MRSHQSLWRRIVASFLLFTFLISNGIEPVRYAQAQELFQLPQPGTRINLSSAFAPPLLKGVKVYPDNPFRLDFILDKGNSSDSIEQLKSESTRLIKYFLASITVPEKDLWVNLSPYEKDRIIPNAFGVTEMGRDLLAQDYILKQITASVIYPEEKIGKEFWDKVYAEARKRYGSADVPIDTFNKVWIVPEKAVVYENKDSVYVVESRLKVLLEEDYLALEKGTAGKGAVEKAKETNKLGSEIVREVVIPILEKEVNEGKNFAQLRQVYHSLILAVWFKDKVKESIFGKAYVDKEKTGGVDIADKAAKNKIWAQYVVAFKKGAYNYIKEDYDSATDEIVTRKYYSGGAGFDQIRKAYSKTPDRGRLPDGVSDSAMIVESNFAPADMAMNAQALNGQVPNRLTIAETRQRLLDGLKAIQSLYPALQQEFANGLEVFRNEGIDAFESKSYPRIIKATDDIKVHVDTIRTLPAVLGFSEPEMREKLETFLHQIAEEAKADKVLIWFGRGWTYDFSYTLGFSEQDLVNFNLDRQEIYSVISDDKKPAADAKNQRGISAMQKIGMFSGLEVSPDFEKWRNTEDAYIRIVVGRSEEKVKSSGEFTEQDRRALEDRLGALIVDGHAPWFGVRDSLQQSQYKDFSDFMMILRHNGGVDIFKVGIFPFIYGHIPQYLKKIRANDAESQKWHDSFISNLEYSAKESHVIESMETFLQLLEQGTDFEVRNISPSVHQRVELFREMAKAKGLDFVTELTDEDLVVRSCDLNLMAVVVDNLVQNAIKYTREGRVIVRLTKKMMKPKYGDNKERESAVFEVEDTGIGIPAEENSKIFSRGYRASNATDIQGTGIGLDAVNTIVNLMHGDVSVESEVGKGTKFIVSLPVDKAQVVVQAQNGGIDLTRDRMGLQIKGNGQGVHFNFDPAMIQQLQNSSGLKPVIINIHRMSVTVPMFLGINDDHMATERFSMR